MNCFDCTAIGETISAVAVCTDCGAGLCMAHAVVGVRYLTRIAVINRIETAEVPGRVVHCRVCAAALEAQARPAERHAHTRR